MTSAAEITSSKGITAKVIRTSRRKTAQVRVDEGKVSILVPDDLSDSRVDEILTKKTQWIRGKMYLHGQALSVQPKEYVSGESFSYLGRNYRLKVLKGSEQPMKLLNGRLQVTLPTGSNSPQSVREALIDWYSSHAEAKIQEKAARYTSVIGVKPTSVGIRDFKSRWGSCHLSGDILYNWKIVIAPNRIVDYVVVHELCHLKQHDHSDKFWKLVSQVIPDYAECKEWLRVNGRALEV
ncbi:MAG: putative metal-dependent hydrolase [Oleiphilaceae bacterium]|jgi:predicted metal-dependent hydrolase